MGKLNWQRYGKDKVRVLRIVKTPSGSHQVYEVSGEVALEGDFAETYLTGNNNQVVPTDTMKNTVHILAQKHLGPVLEEFSIALAHHFLKRYTQVQKVFIELTSRPWKSYQSPGGTTAPYMFLGEALGTPFSRVQGTRERLLVQSGVKDALILKSSDSAFLGYPKCEYTTLPETTERIMATTLTATWSFAGEGVDYARANAAIFSTLLEVYATKFSPSLQNTLYLMGQAALEAAPEITCISLAAPNKHYIPISLKPFGLENNHEIFLPTDEPHGQIEACISRT